MPVQLDHYFQLVLTFYSLLPLPGHSASPPLLSPDHIPRLHQTLHERSPTLLAASEHSFRFFLNIYIYMPFLGIGTSLL